jgi:DNA invertase Pin-like site-specific DNA recombinase
MKQQIIGYIRVSTDDQAAKGNGLEAQRQAILAFAEEHNLEVLEIVREDASGKLGLDERPVLRQAIARCLKLKATLLVSKLDRLSRHAVFILNLMETRAKFIVAQFGMDADAFMVHIYAVLGEKERKMISERTAAALQTLKAKGKVLGNQTNIESARELAADAVSNKANDFAIKMKPSISRMLAFGMSFRAIAAEFNENGTKTARGGLWSAATVSNIVARWA